MYWKTKETSGWPTSARNKSSWLFFSSAFVKWFHLCRASQIFVYTHGPANHLRARVSIQKGRGLDELPAVPTALALERFVRLAESVLVEQKQFTKGVE